MNTHGDYRRNAIDCLRSAQTAKDPFHKALLLRMAESWARLATQASDNPERHDRPPDPALKSA